MSNEQDNIMEWVTWDSGVPNHVLNDVDAFHCYPSSRIHTPMYGYTVPKASLGALDRLPLETITQIITNLDLASLVALRLVNRRGLIVVNSVPQYRLIDRHCRNVVRCIVNISAGHFDLQTLYNTLCSTKCTTCEDYGGFIYLITCRRVCMNCFRERRQFLPLNVKDALRITCLSKETLLQKFPNTCSVRGRYGTLGTMCLERRTMVDRQSVMDTLTEEAATTTELQLEAADRDLEQYDPRRHMSIICAPYFELPAKTLRWGFYCLGCRDYIESEYLFRKQYTKKTFATHIRLYGPVSPMGGGNTLIHVTPNFLTN